MRRRDDRVLDDLHEVVTVFVVWPNEAASVAFTLWDTKMRPAEVSAHIVEWSVAVRAMNDIEPPVRSDPHRSLRSSWFPRCSQNPASSPSTTRWARTA